MGCIVPFDIVTMRWLNESFPDDPQRSVYSAPSRVFMSGYDDPTYMTFRVEFGDWGYSTRDFNTLLTYIQNNTANGYGASYKYRYDDYPCGLLDPNFAEDSIKSFPNYSFNNQVIYNAYNYLLQRNEDTRAEYLKNFIIGLYEIQHDYPYIFQDISGLDTLIDFSSTRGYRIKEGTISIKCIEGLSQKVRTLMELYKKAAWDEIYQRWILPENYRQFKMIIYIFERRQFHTSVRDAGGAIGVDEGGAGPTKQNLGSQIVNFLLSASSYNAMPAAVSNGPIPIGPASFNADLPVKAYECMLCEFDISTKDGDSYLAHWDNSEALSTTIQIKVKNVRTYFQNGLTRKLKNMLIFDLASNVERTYNEDLPYAYMGNVPGQGFMFRDTIMENEMPSSFRDGFGGGGNAQSSSQAKEMWDNMVNNWKALFGKGGKSKNDGMPSAQTARSLMQGADLSYYHDNTAGWWRTATVTGPDIPRAGNFFKYLWSIIKQGTTQIRLSPGYAAAQSAVFYNILPFIDYTSSPALYYYSVATQHKHNNMPKILQPRELADTPEMPEMDNYRNILDNKLSVDEIDYRDVNDDISDSSFVYNESNINVEPNTPDYRDIPEYTSSDTSLIYREEPDISMQNQGAYRKLSEYNLDSIDDYRNTQNSDMTVQEPYRDTPNIDMTAGLTYRNMPETSLNSPESIRDIPEMEMLTPAKERVLTSLEMTGTESVREIPEYQTDSSVEYRQIESDIIFEMADGRSYKVYPIEMSIQSGRQLPENIIVEQQEIINLISKATSGMSQNFQNINGGFMQTERMIKDLLENGNDLYKEYQEQTENRKSIADALIDFKEDNYREVFINRIKTLQQALKQLTEQAARALPEIQGAVVRSKNPEDITKKFSLVPTEVIRRIHNNTLLFSIEPDALNKMSYQSMIGIDKELLRAIADSEALVHVLQPDEISKATTQKQHIESGGIKQVERKTTNGKKLIG